MANKNIKKEVTYRMVSQGNIGEIRLCYAQNSKLKTGKKIKSKDKSHFTIISKDNRERRENLHNYYNKKQ